MLTAFSGHINGAYYYAVVPAFNHLDSVKLKVPILHSNVVHTKHLLIRKSSLLILSTVRT